MLGRKKAARELIVENFRNENENKINLFFDEKIFY